MTYDAVLIDFGGVVANVRMALADDIGEGRYVADVNGSVVESLQRLRRKGVKVCLVSNNDRAAFSELFPYVPLQKWFDAVVFSSDVGANKPRSPIYLEALRQVGVEPDACVFVDDLARNVDAAIGLGMDGFVVESAEGVSAYLRGLTA